MPLLKIVGFACVLILLSWRRLQPRQRGVVLRLGKFHRVVGPGRCWHVPLLEDFVLLDLDDEQPRWTGAPEIEIRRQIAEEYARECDDKARARDLLRIGRTLTAIVLAVASYFLLLVLIAGSIVYFVSGRTPDGQVLGLAFWAMAFVTGVVLLVRRKLRRTLQR